eukprot:5315770-Alexandrium_andersonii.AAC.1
MAVPEHNLQTAGLVLGASCGPSWKSVKSRRFGVSHRVGQLPVAETSWSKAGHAPKRCVRALPRLPPNGVFLWLGVQQR